MKLFDEILVEIFKFTLLVSHWIYLQELTSRQQLLYLQRDQTQVEIYANVDIFNFFDVKNVKEEKLKIFYYDDNIIRSVWVHLLWEWRHVC